MQTSLRAIKGKNDQESEELQVEKIESEKDERADFSFLLELAKLLNTSVDVVKDECCMFQVKNLLKRLSKVIVRYNIGDSELEKVLFNSNALGIEEIFLSSAYLPITKRQINKNGLENFKISTIIDFPFGESSFKSKLADIKDSLKLKVNGVMIMLPTMLLTKEKLSLYKRQIRALCHYKKLKKGVAFAISELSDEQIKWAIKGVEKSKLDYITFAFGEATEMEIKSKLCAIEKFKGKKPIKILGNVSSPEAVMELTKYGDYHILSPYADNIGIELVNRFNIRSAKLR